MRGYNNLEHLGCVREIVRKDAEIGETLLPLCHTVVSLVKRCVIPHPTAPMWASIAGTVNLPVETSGRFGNGIGAFGH